MLTVMDAYTRQCITVNAPFQLSSKDAGDLERVFHSIRKA